MGMIARIWHGRVPKEKAEAYYEFLLRSGIPDYRATEGNRGAFVLRRTEDNVTHYTLISFWESWDAIKPRLAGGAG
jgi:heme-degrading monooxygenase HmoA